MRTRCRLVGGRRDGEYVDVEQGEDRICLFPPLPPASFAAFDPGSPMQDVECGPIQEYRRVDRWTFRIYVPEAEVESKRTPQGGWTREQLAEWGVPWPPPPGWKEQLTRGR